MLEQSIRELAESESDEGIVSVYLKLDPKLRFRRKQAAPKFQGEAARFARNASKWQLEALDREKPKILKFLKSRDFLGRAVAIYASEPAGIWRVLNLDVLVPTSVVVDKYPRVQPLVRILDENPRVVVCVVERDKAAIYVLEGGAIRAESEIESVVPGWHDEGGWAQARYQRHIGFHAGVHMDKVVEELKVAAAGPREPSILIGGVDDVTADLMKRLPGSLKHRVTGTFHVDFKHETTDEIMERARRLWDEEERRREADLVHEIAVEAQAGGAAVLGVQAATAATVEGNVRELVIADGMEAPGAECAACGYLSVQETAACPVCVGPMAAVPDLVERLIERAYLSDVRTESVFGEARDQLMALGGVAAKLRY